MEKTKINLTEEFKENLCSFSVAKKAKAAGMTSANTFYAYDPKGELIDAGWMEADNNIKMIREQTNKPDWQPPLMFPAINLPFAIGMLEDTTITKQIAEGKFECYELWDENKGIEFFFEIGSDKLKSRKLVDLIVEVWIKYKKPEQ